MGVTPGDLAQQNQTHNRKMAINFPFVYFFISIFVFVFVFGHGMFPRFFFFVYFLVCVCLVQIWIKRAQRVETLWCAERLFSPSKGNVKLCRDADGVCPTRQQRWDEHFLFFLLFISSTLKDLMCVILVTLFRYEIEEKTKEIESCVMIVTQSNLFVAVDFTGALT